MAILSLVLEETNIVPSKCMSIFRNVLIGLGFSTYISFGWLPTLVSLVKRPHFLEAASV